MNVDVIVAGCGGMGAAALYELSRRGLKVLGIDQFSPPHDLGSSHGETRIIRKAYFEHPDYVPLLHRTWDLWQDLSATCGTQLIEQRDLLMSGEPDSLVIQGARESARLHQLAVENMSARDAMRRFPVFRLPESHVVTVESTAGYLWVEQCVAAHLEQATSRGAIIHRGETIRSIRSEPTGVEVVTDRGSYSAGALVLTCGAWTGSVVPALRPHLTVLRKTLFWFPANAAWASRDQSPIFLMDLPDGQFYGLPAVSGGLIKAGEHTGGETVADLSSLRREVSPADAEPVRRFAERCLIGVSTEVKRSAVCLYSMSPDGHFLLDRDEFAPVVVAAGFSGHGFKFTPVIGEAIADLVISQTTTLPVSFLSRKRLLNQK